jgi:hypothetical protein
VDFYAKAVALLGLGCLGVLGALIDYGPASTRLPDVPSIIQANDAPSVLTVIDVPGFASVAPMGISISLAAATAPPRRARAIATASVPVLASQTDTADIPMDPPAPAPAGLAAHVAPVRLPVAFRASLSAPPASLELPPALFETGVLTHDIPMIPAAEIRLARGPVEDDGFFPGVLKRTGSSIGKAGSSLVGAFRFVGGAVKRAF